MRSTQWKLGLLASVSLMAITSVAPVNAADIGQVAAVNRDMDGTPPNTSKRQLELGFGVVENERIETSERGSGQLLFVDQTSLTVSQNSDILLDKYVYDASADQGDMAMTMTKGALRFIGGRITKKRRAMVRTPTATIGIRGGLVIIRVLPDGTTRVTQMAGDSTTVESYGDSNGDGVDDGPPLGQLESYFSGDFNQPNGVIILSRAGATAEIFPAGSGGTGQTGGSGSGGTGSSGERSEVRYVGIISTEELADAYEDFEGGRSGGTDNVPSDGEVAEGSGEIASVNSDQPGGQNNQPVSTSGEEPPQPPDPLLESVQEESPIVDAIEIIPVEELTDFFPEDDVLAEVTGTTLSGGSISINFLPPIPFSEIQTGSIIGTLLVPVFGVEAVTIDLPETASELEAFGPGGDEFFAQSRFPNSGFFTVATTFDPLGLTGISDGFAVFSNETDAEFVLAEAQVDVEDSALIFLGRNTPDQNQAFATDPLLDTGEKSLTAFQVENLTEDQIGANPDTFKVISNGPGDGDGARAFFASLEDDSDSGIRELTVVGGALTREATGGPKFDFTVASIGTDDFANEVFVFEEQLSAFEDLEGHTLFGPENDFIVVGGPLGIETEFILAEGSSFTFADTSDLTLLTRDPAGREVISNPDATVGNVPNAQNPGQQAYDSVLATGFASCGDGRTCGQLNANYYTLSSQALPGGDLSTVGNLTFDFEENSVTGGFLLQAGGASNTVPSNQVLNTNFTFNLAPEGSAAASDQNFAGATFGTALDPIPGATNPTSDFIIASAESVRAPEILSFPAGTNPLPTFATWGFWAASFDVVDSQNLGQGRDVVDLGLYVAGVRPGADFANIGNVIGGFDGVAVATVRDQLAPGLNGVSTIETGSFDLTYIFSDRSGTLNIDLPSANLSGNVIGNVNNPIDPTYSGGISGGNFTGTADGVFYTGGNQVVAATGGQFNALDSAGATEITGVFAGDRGPDLQP